MDIQLEQLVCFPVLKWLPSANAVVVIQPLKCFILNIDDTKLRSSAAI